MHRRQFVRRSTALLAAFHPAILTRAAAVTEAKKPACQIESLSLLTPSLAKTYDFFAKVMELPHVECKDDRVVVRAGASKLIFQPAPTEHALARYHVAFNIPENKLDSAKAWMEKRTKILRGREGQEIFHFDSWNAHAFYFADEQDNLLELIARHDLKNAASGEFSPKDLMNASEIGLVVDDVPATMAQVKEQLGLPEYRPGTDQFATTGDENGLLIIFKRGRKTLPDHRKTMDPFPATVQLRSAKHGTCKLKDLSYTLTST